MSEIEITDNMHEACRIMGWPVSSGDRFVRRALEFLCQWQREDDGTINLDKSGLSCLAGDDDDGWSVRGNDYSAGGETLIDALCGAIFCVKESPGTQQRMAKQ